MSETDQFVAPPQPRVTAKTPRQRRAFWRKFLFAVLLFLAISGGTFVYLMGGARSAYQVFSMAGKYAVDKATSTPPFGGQRQVNILILGTDEDFGCSRSDTMKFVHLDLDSQRISILSIPRDTWVTLPNGVEGRINGAYALGMADRDKSLYNAKMAVETLLSETSGQPIHIDYYLRMQVDQFENVVAALGGVDLNVEKQMDYDDPSQNLHIHLSPGMQHLDAYNTMCYVRFRHDNEGDYGRIRRQNQFLRELAAKLRNSSGFTKLTAIGPILKMTYSNLTANDILAAKRLTDSVGMDGMQMLTLPTVPTQKGAAAVVEIQDQLAAAGTIRDTLNGPRVTVALVNGTKHVGLARAATAQVDTSRFNVLGTGTVPPPATTTHIFAPANFSVQAQALAAALGLPPVIDSSTPTPDIHFDNIAALSTPAQITVVLGEDYHPQTITAALPNGMPVDSAHHTARRMQISRHRGTISRTTGGNEPIGAITTRPTHLESPRGKKGAKSHSPRPAGPDSDGGLLRDSNSLLTDQQPGAGR